MHYAGWAFLLAAFVILKNMAISNEVDSVHARYGSELVLTRSLKVNVCVSGR